MNLKKILINIAKKNSWDCLVYDSHFAIISINSKLKKCVIFDNTRQVTDLLFKKIIKNNQIIYNSPS